MRITENLRTNLLFSPNFEYFRKLRNNDSLITQLYHVIIYSEYNENDLHRIIVQMTGHLPIVENKTQT